MSDVAALVEQWLKWDNDPETRAEIEQLAADKKDDELRSILGSRLVFGTAGLRGPIRAGFKAMNNLTIIQAAQGLAKYVAETIPDATTRGVVLGYDQRRKSDVFARITAVAFAKFGIPSKLYSKLVPTPFVPYLITRDGAAAGVMVTASHNPAADNGYKVYWSDGIQINPPHDSNIEKSIGENLEPWECMKDLEGSFADAQAAGLISDPMESVEQTYFNDCAERTMFRTAEENSKAQDHVKIAYSAMHGVGYRYSMAIAERFGFDIEKLIVPVEAQIHPDGTFPTSAKPNPERPENLVIGKKVAEEAGARVLLANDPDADRVAMAEHLPDGTWKTFHGNEIGALLCEWIFSNLKTKRGADFDASKLAFVNSTVSSKMIAAIARAEGAQYREVLTGFRWIGREANILKEEGYECVFGFEEAIGYMVSNLVLDKDGVSAFATLCEMVAQTYKEGRTLQERYESLIAKYGMHNWSNSFFELTDLSVVDTVFERLRTGGEDGGYIMKYGEHRVTAIRDLKAPGYDSTTEDHKPLLHVSGSHMLTLTFDNTTVLTLRPSGTEPLLKYYAEIRGEKKDVESVVAAVKAEIEACM